MNRKISFAEGEYYHIYNRGVEKRDIFLDNSDRERFQKLLFLCNGSKPIVYRLVQGPTLYGAEKGEPIVAIGAYVLMLNHFHLLLKETRANGITEFMRKLTTGYSMYFNKKYTRVGPLVQGKFKAEHVDNDEYLKYLYAYIHLNPVKLIDSKWKENGITDRKKAERYLKDYRYSSYVDYLGEKREEDAILAQKEFPGYFEGENEFEMYVKDWINYRDEIETLMVDVK